MEPNKKYCKFCGEIIDSDCIICPKCGKQVEELKTATPNIVINNANTSTNTNVNKNTNTAVAGGYATSQSSKSKMITLVLCIFLGYFGIHRFYVGKIGSGIIYLCTGGVCGLGWLYDIFKIATGTFTDGAGLVIRK